MSKLTISSSSNPKVLLIHAAGMGMSGLASMLITIGWKVFGWDDGMYPRMKMLINHGLINCTENSLPSVDVVIYSELMEKDEVHDRFSVSSNLILSLYEFLNIFVKEMNSNGIVGSYGKTTVTAMLFSIFNANNIKPFVFAGEIIRQLGDRASIGDSDLCLIEIPEAKKQLTLISCTNGLLLNVEDMSLMKLFDRFSRRIQDKLLINGDDALLKEHKWVINPIFFGFDNDNYKYSGEFIKCSSRILKIKCKFKGKYIGNICVPILGKYNGINVLAAFALAMELGIDFKYIKLGLEEYKGIINRGEIVLHKKNCSFISDIAHHPEAIYQVIKASSNISDFNKVVVLYQPHMYDEITLDSYQFVNAFQLADEVYIFDVCSLKDTCDSDGLNDFISFANKESFNTSWNYFDIKEDMHVLISKVITNKILILYLGMYLNENIKKTVLEALTQ